MSDGEFWRVSPISDTYNFSHSHGSLHQKFLFFPLPFMWIPSFTPRNDKYAISLKRNIIPRKISLGITSIFSRFEFDVLLMVLDATPSLICFSPFPRIWSHQFTTLLQDLLGSGARSNGALALTILIYVVIYCRAAVRVRDVNSWWSISVFTISHQPAA